MLTLEPADKHVTMPRFRAPRGTQDILPADQPHWDLVRRAVERLCEAFGYARIETPVFEEASLFARGVGEVTDIVQKEMYVFQDRGGLELALRPEGTAPVCRAYLQHGMHVLPQPVRLWYWTPIFRYDRPQAGRYRQHTQFGAEAIGDGDPAVDAETVELLWRLYEDLGLDGLTLHLNSIGDPVCRPRYLNVLRDYYRDKLKLVCNDCEGRYERNPLRLLDCKQERCQPVIAGAPPFTDYLCDACAEHFQRLRAYLDDVGIPHVLNPRLVRGLDYYTRTVFEVQPREEGAQSTVGGGGRYDGLLEELGGPPTPGVGFATGIERIVLNLKRQEVAAGPPARPRVYVAFQTPAARAVAFKLASDLRRQGVPAQAASGGRSLKAQMRQADALGAEYAAIIGERELRDGVVALRRLADGSQETVPLAEVAARVCMTDIPTTQ
ncbi:MAG TPA: histidine--tRNA ligase [Dehalococcoidia bacterium]|nr:histidine--tRNA ligase [Dehalococcoidia bacterium]